MGVQGLWQLIERAGKPVPVETLQNRILAVDVSIWLHQLVKGVNNDAPNRNANSHLLALFRRICKLLFFRIKPIFVFDGGVPALKKKTIAARQRMRARAGKAGEKARMELVENLIKRHALAGKPLDCVQIPSAASTSASASDAMFRLPPLPERTAADSESMIVSSDSASDDENSRYTSFGDLHSIDVAGKDFLALPPDIRHSILTELKETRKQNSWARIKEMPENIGNFSSFQMGRLLKRRKVQISLEEAENEMGGVSLTLNEINDIMAEQGLAIAKRIASDSTTSYIYASNSAGKGAPEKTSLSPVGEESEDDSRETRQFTADSFDESSNSVSLIDSSADSGAELSQRQLLEIIRQQNGREEADDLQRAIRQSLEAMEAENRIKNEENALDSAGSSRDNKSDRGIPQSPDSGGANNFEKQTSGGRNENGDEDAVLTASRLGSNCSLSDERRSVQSSYDSVREILSEGQKSRDSNEDGNKSGIEGPVRPVCEMGSICGTVDERKTVESAGESRNVAPESESVTGIDDDDTSEDGDDFVEIPADVSSPEHTAELNDSALFESTEYSKPTMAGYDVNSEKVKPATAGDKVPSPPPPGCLQIVVDTAAKIDDDGEEDDMFADVFAEPQIRPEPDRESYRREWKPETTVVSGISAYFADRPTVDDAEPSPPKDIEPVKRLTKEEIIIMKEKLERESRELLVEANREERLAASISDQMTLEAQELLQLFGIPYLVAPMEAEAQCAHLEATDQTHGTISDDSDIWLFGAANVYKNFFNQKKYVLQFKATDIHRCYRLKREELILVALLIGSDYTEGVKGVGPVTALEILAEFPARESDPSPEERLNRFATALNAGRLAGTPLAKKLANVAVSQCFPSREVVKAYLSPVVNDDREKFSWGVPDLAGLRDYARHKFGWDRRKTDDTLLPVLDKTAQNKTQMTLHGYFDWSVESLNSTARKKRSKRVERAVGLLGGGGGGGGEEEVTAAQKKRRTTGDGTAKGAATKEVEEKKRRKTNSGARSSEKTAKEAAGAPKEVEEKRGDARRPVGAPSGSHSPTVSHQKSREIAARQAARVKAARILAKLRTEEKKSDRKKN